jgi:hypothetical protein
LQILLIVSLLAGISTGIIAAPTTVSFTVLLTNILRFLLVIPLTLDNVLVAASSRRAAERSEGLAADLEAAVVRQENNAPLAIPATPGGRLLSEQLDRPAANILPSAEAAVRYSPLFSPPTNNERENLAQAESTRLDLTPVPDSHTAATPRQN